LRAERTRDGQDGRRGDEQQRWPGDRCPHAAADGHDRAGHHGGEEQEQHEPGERREDHRGELAARPAHRGGHGHHDGPAPDTREEALE